MENKKYKIELIDSEGLLITSYKSAFIPSKGDHIFFEIYGNDDPKIFAVIERTCKVLLEEDDTLIILKVIE